MFHLFSITISKRPVFFPIISNPQLNCCTFSGERVVENRELFFTKTTGFIDMLINVCMNKSLCTYVLKSQAVHNINQVLVLS